MKYLCLEYIFYTFLYRITEAGISLRLEIMERRILLRGRHDLDFYLDYEIALSKAYLLYFITRSAPASPPGGGAEQLSHTPLPRQKESTSALQPARRNVSIRARKPARRRELTHPSHIDVNG